MTKDEAIAVARTFTRREKLISRERRELPVIATPVAASDGAWRVHLWVRFRSRPVACGGCAVSTPLEVMFGHWQLLELFRRMRSYDNSPKNAGPHSEAVAA